MAATRAMWKEGGYEITWNHVIRNFNVAMIWNNLTHYKRKLKCRVQIQ